MTRVLFVKLTIDNSEYPVSTDVFVKSLLEKMDKPVIDISVTTGVVE